MPPKSKKPLTDEEKYQLELQAETDLGRLQRQYGILERNRNQFAQGVQGKLAKQGKVLEIVKKEHNNIQTDLSVATAPGKKKEDEKVSETLNALLEEYNYYSLRVNEEKTHIKEVEGQIKMMKKEVQALAALQVTDRQFQDRVWNGMKTLETLENKLEVQIRKFCSICSDNRAMRQQIDHLLIERQNFLKTWERLIRNLTSGKKFMLDLIEQATIAYDQREEWCSKLQALRMKAHNDLVHNTQEMQELQRKQENYKKLEEFLSVKGQKRVMRDLEEKERIKRDEQRKKLREQMDGYEQMMESILEFTGEKNTKIIAKKFLKQEEYNFTLFKYVNDLIGEMESLNDNLGYLQLDIDERRALHEARAEQQNSRLENLDKELEDAIEKVHESDQELKEHEKKLNIMMDGIGTLFSICGCTNDPLLQLLGDNAKINYHNVLLYAEILEKRVQELLLQVNYRDQILLDKRKIQNNQKVIKEEKTPPQIYNIDEMVPSNPCPLCVEHEQVSDVIDRLQHVLTREQVKQRLESRLQLPDGQARVHNVSACHLPKSRQIIQKRYQ